MHGKLQKLLFKKIAEQALIFMSTGEITQNKGKLDVWSYVHFIPQKAVLSACGQSLDSLGILLLSKLIIILAVNLRTVTAGIILCEIFRNAKYLVSLIGQEITMDYQNNPGRLIIDYTSKIIFTLHKTVISIVLILYVPSTIFQLNRDGSSWVEPVLR